MKKQIAIGSLVLASGAAAAATVVAVTKESTTKQLNSQKSIAAPKAIELGIPDGQLSYYKTVVKWFYQDRFSQVLLASLDRLKDSERFAAWDIANIAKKEFAEMCERLDKAENIDEIRMISGQGSNKAWRFGKYQTKFRKLMETYDLLESYIRYVGDVDVNSKDVSFNKLRQIMAAFKGDERINGVTSSVKLDRESTDLDQIVLEVRYAKNGLERTKTIRFHGFTNEAWRNPDKISEFKVFAKQFIELFLPNLNISTEKLEGTSFMKKYRNYLDYRTSILKLIDMSSTGQDIIAWLKSERRWELVQGYLSSLKRHADIVLDEKPAAKPMAEIIL